MSKTLTQVRDRVWRINHPQTNAYLTRTGGFPGPKLVGRIFNAVGLDSLECQDIEFRRGNNTKKWYVAIT